MLRWLASLLPGLLATVLCYLTNWIVILFANEDGELPSFLHLWQTWDDSCDSAFFMRNICPSWLDYGYDEHYILGIGYDERTAKYGKLRWFSTAQPGAVWTRKQRIQRYFCRLWWLTRNCGYGFAFYWLGADMTYIKWHRQETDHFLGSVGSWLTEPFVYKNETQICGRLYWKIYLGWKTYPGCKDAQRCMLAYRLWFNWEA